MKFLITKAAALVLIWNLCLSTTLWSTYSLAHPVIESVTTVETESILYTILIAIVLLALPLSGWLADSRFGNFKVFRAGCVLMFLGSVLLCVCILIVNNSDNEVSLVTSEVLSPFFVLFSSGSSACLVTVFQLGLDQMPDASSAGITSFIYCFFITLYLGFWVGDVSFMLVSYCVDMYFVQASSLLPVVCMCIVLSSLFIFGKKWLIIEPKSPQSLKNIYRVLKFAAKHKSPLNRSALTYWEEDIPSRLDLGKSRFGGPFTTEQVEDVKTFFRLLLVLLPVWVAAVSASIFGVLSVETFSALEHPNSSAQLCVDSVYMMVTYNPWWCCFVTLLVYKVCVCLCLKNKLPSMLKRLGIFLFLLSLTNVTYSIVGYFFKLSLWPHIVHTLLYSLLISLTLATSLEFVCAQSPYSMRGLLSGLYFFFLIMSVTLGMTGFNSFLGSCHSKHCLIIPYSIGGGLSIAGFLLYLVVAGRYKRRVRDEEYNPQTHIEAIYDRYLTQAQASHPY